MTNQLYKRSASGPYLRCLGISEQKEALTQMHEGFCGNHAGGRALAIRIKKQGYFWPTMIADCDDHAKKCQKCQRHSPMINQPSEPMSSTIVPYPFMKWSMDVIGPLEPSGCRKFRFLLVLTDNFSKWVEAEPYASISGHQVADFIWKNIICRHGLPSEILTDNGTNLTSKPVKELCEKWKIKLTTSTPRYPQGNGQAEATNKTILSILKKRLDSKKSFWSGELQSVLWAHRTSPKRATGETPFSLLFGVEAMVPAEISLSSPRRELAPEQEEENIQELENQVDFIDERRDQALLRMQNYRNCIAKFYNSKLKTRRFMPGELVLRKVFENTRELNAGKLGATWEGPYQVVEETRPGVYRLANVETEEVFQRPWNVFNLKKFYV